MYSYEIKQLLDCKNNEISASEYINILSNSPQINFIKFDPYSNTFKITTNDNYNFELRVILDIK